jgi:hypothetical protein
MKYFNRHFCSKLHFVLNDVGTVLYFLHFVEFSWMKSETCMFFELWIVKFK